MKVHKNQRHVCHLFISSLANESRLFKELKTAEAIGKPESLVSIGRAKGDDILEGKLEGRYPYELIKLRTEGLPKTSPFQILKFFEWTIRAGIKAARSGAKIFHCHSLPAAPATVLAKILNPGSRFIYDAHELETRRANMSVFRQKMSAVLERLVIHFVDEILVVSPSIERHYRETYPRKNITLLMNMPTAQKVEPTGKVRQRLGLSQDDKLVIYVGALAPKRGIDLLIDAIENAEDWHALFLGSGPLEKTINVASKRNRRIHYLPPVAEDQILNHIAEANLSYCVIDCSADSYRYALPNKFFQSLSAGVPVLVNDLNIDMITLGEEHAGVFSVSYSSVDVSKHLKSLRRKPVVRTENRYVWETQQAKIVRLYSDLMLELD